MDPLHRLFVNELATWDHLQLAFARKSVWQSGSRKSSSSLGLWSLSLVGLRQTATPHLTVRMMSLILVLLMLLLLLLSPT